MIRNLPLWPTNSAEVHPRDTEASIPIRERTRIRGPLLEGLSKLRLIGRFDRFSSGKKVSRFRGLSPRNAFSGEP